jgi:hypothetical protein
MSYEKILEYKIIPTEPFKIVRGCSGCGCKHNFICKNNFRVNANGNRIDIWLIYGCEKCNHTYNLPIYERMKPSKISSELYQQFLSNNLEAVNRYGIQKALFTQNRAEIAWELMQYEILPVTTSESDPEKENVLFKIANPYNLPVRIDKILSEITQISRSKIKHLLKEGKLSAKIVK